MDQNRKPYRFSDHLKQSLAKHPPSRKGDRTRAKFEIATAELLEEKGFHAMTAAEISMRAALSEGTFYIYFKDKTDITETILKKFLKNMEGVLVNRGELQGSDVFAVIKQTNLRWIEAVQDNRGLMRCVLEAGHEFPGFAAIANELNRQWYDRVTESVLRHCPNLRSKGGVRFAVAVLGSMVDEVVRRVSLDDGSAETVFGTTEASDLATLAEVLSVIWCRVVYPNTLISGLNSHLAIEIAQLDKTAAALPQ